MIGWARYGPAVTVVAIVAVRFVLRRLNPTPAMAPAGGSPFGGAAASERSTLGEAAWNLNPDWTIFSRVEAIETDELGLIHHGPVEDVARVTVGVSRDFRLNDTVTMVVGASATQNWTSDTLAPPYDGDPTGMLGFVRFKVG